MYAIVETGGKQYKVAADDVFRVEKLEGNVGDEVKLDKILAVEKDGDMTVGKPYVEGASVKAEIKRQGKGKKVTVFHYKPKKRIRVKNGHRQQFTALQVKEIVAK
ncbi:MAG: 50S ribosomal protein L21 [Vulcanimicrobiota bacterium]